MAFRAGWMVVLVTAFSLAAEASLEPYGDARGSCVFTKAELEKADPALQKALAPFAPFEKRIWKGESSDIHIDEKGAVLRIHKELAAMAEFFANEKPVQKLTEFSACVDRNNKPYFSIGKTGAPPTKVYMSETSVTLRKDDNHDTFKIVHGKMAQPQTAKVAPSQVGPGPAKAQPILN